MVLHSRGCGRVARRRIQLMDLLVEPHRGSRKVLFLFPHTRVFLHSVEENGRRKARGREDRSSEWMDLDAGKSANVPIPPVSGGFQAVEGLWAY